MSLEAASFINALVATNPEGTDPKSQGDDHLRMLKSVLKQQFAGLTDGIPITRTETELNAMLIAGAFGLGLTAIPFQNANLIPDETGFYGYAGAGANFPPGASGGDTVIHILSGPLTKTQIWQRLDGQQFTRSFDTSTWSPWVPGVTGEVQQHLLDATAGRLMVVGAFGWGTRGELSAALNIDIPENFNYLVGTVSATGTKPPLGGPNDMVFNLSYSATYKAQLYFNVGGQTVWARFIISGSVTSWVCLSQVGSNQSWQDMTASRALNTLYTNTTGRTIVAMITVTGSSNTNAFIEGQVNGVSLARQQITDFNGASFPGIRGHLTLTVPAGATYAVTPSGTAGLDLWTELR